MTESQASLGVRSLLEELEQLKRRVYEAQRDLTSSVRADVPTKPFDFLGCTVAGEPVGLLLKYVDEVVPIARMTPLPEAPPWAVGLLNLRGASVPVLDVAARFRRTGRALSLSDLVVICEVSGKKVGLIVQSVEDVYRAQPSSLQPVTHGIPHAPYLQSVVHTERASVLLLNIMALVALSDLPEEPE